MNFRVGIGYDVHRFAKGRRCIIGGIEFQHEQGLLGHSDADVLLHAICDALLGAANLGDIGDHFPPSDDQFKDADSTLLLKQSYALVQEKGYVLGNLDTVVICEKPKIKPKRQEIQRKIAHILDVEPDQVSIKATTEEGMGFTGSEQGIKAVAYVLLRKK